MKKNLLLMIGILVLIASNVYATGISDVSPKALELLPGESGRFYFQVQAALSKQDLSCSINFQNTDAMVVEFDQETIEVPAGEVRDVLGTITAPQAIAYGNYIENFCVSCGPAVPVTESASKVSFNTCGLKIVVDVVAQRTRQNMPLPQKPYQMPAWQFALLIFVAVVLVVVAWMIWKKTSKPKNRKK